ncbi:hypothetical protein ZIOFF_051625 [Zingiber officinale]|uniref:Uncharacterized protein n=1 Tax=Zingiber officinale TaxID=94328 RepID=A0A8J5KHH9_ZINOF|nr:hypothetical protein ZIOFF_051625 [Zingiber officinale]
MVVISEKGGKGTSIPNIWRDAKQDHKKKLSKSTPFPNAEEAKGNHGVDPPIPPPSTPSLTTQSTSSSSTTDHGRRLGIPESPYKFRSFPLPPSSGLQLRKCEGRNRPNFRSFSSLSSLSSSIPEMEMRKIACVVLVATAAAATTALAAEAPAPGPAASASFAVTPAAGAAIGASLLSFFAFFLQ